MSSNYIQMFDIHQIFKTNDIQNIFIGSPKGKKDEYVIINVLRDKRFLQKKFKDQLQRLQNLVYFEELGDEVVFATSVNQGIDLKEYIKQNTLDIKKRLNLAYQYLGKIVKYDGFPDDIKDMLIEESQIVMKDKNISFNEVFLIKEDEGHKKYNFKKVAQSVGTVLATILFSNITSRDKHTDVSEIIALISNLEYNTHKYKSLSDIFQDFEQIYTNILSSLDLKKTTQDIWTKDDNNYDAKQFMKESKLPYIKKTLIVGLIIGSSALLWTGAASRVLNITEEIKKENEIFLSETSKDLTLTEKEKGMNEASLQVRDKHNNWSEGYSRKINAKGDDTESNIGLDELQQDHVASESLEKLNISYLTSELTMADKSTLRNGVYSLKFKGTEDRLSKSIAFNNVDVNLEGTNTLFLWIMSDKLEKINLDFHGYDNEHVIFEKSIQHYPRLTGVWERINFDIPPKKITKINMTVVSSDPTVWIDDVKIDVYK
ncbi:MAG: hypothetical protein JJT76_04010 [Clostridiaceae bacterium]|nr:hypothetical protein [Clostridiaceae bacterium]